MIKKKIEVFIYDDTNLFHLFNLRLSPETKNAECLNLYLLKLFYDAAIFMKNINNFMKE